jgi:diadenosine tetraphosphate (Ap4A) HIT family hydrolase
MPGAQSDPSDGVVHRDALSHEGTIGGVSRCHICDLHARLGDLPVRERIHLDEHWRVAHGWSSLEGWLVVCARRHVQALDELDPAEAASLGPLLAAATSALRAVVGCERTYLVLFAEKPEFRHVHLHVVPRMASFTDADIGPNVFRFLNAPEPELVNTGRRDELAAQLQENIERQR